MRKKWFSCLETATPRLSNPIKGGPRYDTLSNNNTVHKHFEFLCYDLEIPDSNSSPTASLLSRRPLKMNKIHMYTSRTKKQTKPVKPHRMRREWFLKQESLLNEITHSMTVTPYNKVLDLIN